NDRCANAKQPEKGASKDDDISRIPRHELRSAHVAAAHVFKCAASPAGIFNCALPRPDASNNAGSTANEQFIRESTRNDPQRDLEKVPVACYKRLERVQV